MTYSKLIPLLTLATVAGCASPEPQEPNGVPDAVIAIADPRQNLATARLREADNCYWYEYAGPVETTLLPLKSIEGRPICAG
nr:hypothetical protein [Roseobacter sp. CCS2]